MKIGSKLGFGLILLILNTPVGLGGMSLCTFLAVKTQITIFYLLGIALYGFGWIMLWIGLMLTGSAGPYYLKLFWKRGWRRGRAFVKKLSVFSPYFRASMDDPPDDSQSRLGRTRGET